MEEELTRFMEQTREAIEKDTKNKIEELTIDQMIDIYKGKYSCYEEYMHNMRELTENIRLLNSHNFKESLSNGCLSFKYYAEPIILNKHVFEYIRFKRMEEKNE